MNVRFDVGEATVKNVNYSSLLKDVFNFTSNNEDPTTANTT